VIRVGVDPVECIGCGLCARLCPTVFRQTDFIATTVVDTVEDAMLAATVRETAARCPVDAITVADAAAVATPGES
jgi:ferredoxin